MPQERKIVRQAADNKYLHKDFHNIMNIGLKYVEETYGSEAVREYLRQYASAYYAPLKKAIIQNGLSEIEAYFRDVYEKEEWTDHVLFERDENILVVKIDKCPAVTHILRAGDKISPLYMETTKTVCGTICEDTGIDFMILKYDENNGAAQLRFSAGKESL